MSINLHHDILSVILRYINDNDLKIIKDKLISYEIDSANRGLVRRRHSTHEAYLTNKVPCEYVIECGYLNLIKRRIDKGQRNVLYILYNL